MNNDLISREALKKSFDEYGEKAKFTQDFCQQLIDKTPTVPQECSDCKRGEWIKDIQGNTVCSNCGFECLYSEDCMHHLTGAAENMEFAKWVTKMIFDNGVEDFDFDLFSELACRKLEQMGLVEKTGSRWKMKGGAE